MSRSQNLQGRNVLLGISGSVAAYKAVLLTRLLLKAGANVDVLLTRAAEQFVGAATFYGLTGRPVHQRMFEPESTGEIHVKLAQSADLLLLAPATADLLARLAQGRADDLLGATALAFAGPTLIAPAMHPQMWNHEATQTNASILRQRNNVHFEGPEDGVVASGDSGTGRMSEPEDILKRAAELLGQGPLVEKHVVVSAGPTMEDIDPVRFISNRSSGKMGYAIAEAAARAGAKVTLVSGPVSLDVPPGVQYEGIRSALEMQAALEKLIGDEPPPDALIMAAAVGDYRPFSPSATKLKRKTPLAEIKLTKNPDILASLGAARQAKRPLLMGFALETSTELVTLAREKLRRKQVDAVVVNHANDSLGRDENRIIVVTESHQSPVWRGDKRELARRLICWLAQALSSDPSCATF